MYTTQDNGSYPEDNGSYPEVVPQYGSYPQDNDSDPEVVPQYAQSCIPGSSSASRMATVTILTMGGEVALLPSQIYCNVPDICYPCISCK